MVMSLMPAASEQRQEPAGVNRLGNDTWSLLADESFWEVSDQASLQESSQGQKSFLEALSGSTGTAGGTNVRELVWALVHRDMMPFDVADALLDLNERRASSQVRKALSAWIDRVSNTCARPLRCQDIARQVLLTDELTCPTAYVLAQTQLQLYGAWSHSMIDGESHAVKELLLDANVTADQLAVKRWGIRLLSATGALSNATVASALLSADSFQDTLPKLELLVSGLKEQDADHLHLVRQFLKAVEKQTQGRHPLSATGSPDNLLKLLRLLHEQRAQATASTLIRDAVLVDFYESRVKDLEAKWAQFDARCARAGSPDHCAGYSGEVGNGAAEPGTTERHGTQGTDTLPRLQAQARKLATILSRLASDHATALPADAGALPAYWAGRVERVRRRLQDHASGRGVRPTVLIWTCSFGGGHWAATKAIQGYLPDYTTVVTDPTRDREYYEGDMVGNWIRRFIQPEWDETYLFNQFVLRNKVYRLESTLEYLLAFRGWLRGDGTRFASPCRAPTCDYKDKKLMRRVLLRTAPDLVVTVYHMDLLPIAELCDELGGLPLMHLSTDANVKMREVFGERPCYPNLRVGLPFDVPEAWPTIAPLAEGQAFVSGYSVRGAFLRPLPTPTQREWERLRRRIGAGSRVVLMMSGSEGQSVDWPLRLAESETWDEPLHVIVVAARNREFGAALESQLQPLAPLGGVPHFRGQNGNVTVEVARDPAGALRNAEGEYNEFYLSGDEVSSLMDIADALITKAGGSTVAEAAYRGTPVIFDATGGMLSWEEFNAKVFENHGHGIRMISVANLERDLRRAFGLSRDRPLVRDRLTGHAIDSRRQIRQEMEHMLRSFASRSQQL